ncbi:site-specific DNA-methyltransferase [Acinetobacter haemolyticus]|uniref:site-specific DNA-methyltransferase n=1 Tax=Acinetobacter haemolyticus TaxID=29430 RepID=UPI00031F3D22|nr:site-specific DNA-methyltransferase [Acinetobacter haemolyticus]
MSDQLKMHSPNLVDSNIEKIAALFPNCITETKNENGELKKAVDFDLLKQELSQVIVEGEQERYRLDWVGKKEAILTANAPIAKTLRPCREESVNFDTTENLFIEGDNLEALKLLQENYLGKVKMIYIDPPYNTGNDFIYEDDFAESTDEFFERSNQVDEEGNRLVANKDTNGRFHSDWLTMIYSRLKLARNLLTDDGVIFISINHKEISNLEKVLKEIFGEHNFLCLFSWKTDGNFDNQAKFKVCNEYIFAFAKQENLFPAPQVIDPNTPSNSKLFKENIINTIVKNGPKNPISSVTIPKGFPTEKESGVLKCRSASYPIIKNDILFENYRTTVEGVLESGWSSKDLLMEFISNKFNPILDAKGQSTTFRLSNSGTIEVVKTRSNSSHVISTLYGLGGSQQATGELSEINIIFDDYPKPTALIEYLISMNNADEFIVLDFFAGSATTAHAVMKANTKDKGNRKFILVQLDEEINPIKKAFTAGYTKISEISKERIRRAGNKIVEDNKDKEGIENLDIGFRVLKIDSSNMKDVYYTPDAYTQADILDLADHIKADRTSEDLLFQVMLDWGLELSLPIERKTIAGKEVLYVAGNSLVACFDELTFDVVDEVAKDHPLRFVSAEKAIHLDHDKTNIKERFKQLSPDTEVKFL